MDAFAIKMNGVLYPANQSDRALFDTIKQGEPRKITIKTVRNYPFLQKYMVMMRRAFELWEAPDDHVYKGVPIEKNFDEFRRNITIMAGHYQPVYDINGNLHLRAKSIAFPNMKEEEFSELFAKTIDVIIKMVQTRYTDDELRAHLQIFEAFE